MTVEMTVDAGANARTRGFGTINGGCEAKSVHHARLLSISTIISLKSHSQAPFPSGEAWRDGHGDETELRISVLRQKECCRSLQRGNADRQPGPLELGLKSETDKRPATKEDWRLAAYLPFPSLPFPYSTRPHGCGIIFHLTQPWSLVLSLLRGQNPRRTQPCIERRAFRGTYCSHVFSLPIEPSSTSCTTSSPSTPGQCSLHVLVEVLMMSASQEQQVESSGEDYDDDAVNEGQWPSQVPDDNDEVPLSPTLTSGATVAAQPPHAAHPMQKRRRVTRACDECRRKKIKCDGKQPCTHCTVYSYGQSNVMMKSKITSKNQYSSLPLLARGFHDMPY